MLTGKLVDEVVGRFSDENYETLEGETSSEIAVPLGTSDAMNELIGRVILRIASRLQIPAPWLAQHMMQNHDVAIDLHLSGMMLVNVGYAIRKAEEMEEKFG